MGMFRSLRRMPFFKLFAVAQVVLLARRHYRGLSGAERRRLRTLVRQGRHMDDAERKELRAILGKLEPRAFAGATADAFSPVPLPRWLRGGAKG
jgi:hypothetical protein